jgi:conjugative transfer region protein TrbK
MRIAGKTLARIGAAVFVAAAIALTIAQVAREAGRNGEAVLLPRPEATPDPLAAEVARCAALGEAALRDRACLEAWAEHRRRFLAPRTPAAPEGSAATPPAGSPR